MKRLIGVLVLGAVLGIGGGCKKSAKEQLVGKWQRSPDGVIAEILADGTVTVGGNRFQYEILGEGRMKSWPLKDPSGRGAKISTIVFIADTLVILMRNQLWVQSDSIGIDSTSVRRFDPASLEAGRVTKWVRVK